MFFFLTFGFFFISIPHASTPLEIKKTRKQERESTARFWIRRDENGGKADFFPLVDDDADDDDDDDNADGDGGDARSARRRATALVVAPAPVPVHRRRRRSRKTPPPPPPSPPQVLQEKQ